MTDLYVWLESQATILRAEACPEGRSDCCEHPLATLIDGMLEPGLFAEVGLRVSMADERAERIEFIREPTVAEVSP